MKKQYIPYVVISISLLIVVTFLYLFFTYLAPQEYGGEVSGTPETGLKGLH